MALQVAECTMQHLSASCIEMHSGGRVGFLPNGFTALSAFFLLVVQKNDDYLSKAGPGREKVKMA